MQRKKQFLRHFLFLCSLHEIAVDGWMIIPSAISSRKIITECTSTTTTSTNVSRTSSLLSSTSSYCYSIDDDDDGDDDDDENLDKFITLEKFTLEQFKRRKEVYERRNRLKQIRRPPNPFLSPKELITEILYELRHPATDYSCSNNMNNNNNNNHNNDNNNNHLNDDQHNMHSGILCLLQSSTKSWQRILCQSVGITINTTTTTKTTTTKTTTTTTTTNTTDDDDDNNNDGNNDDEMIIVACSRLERFLKQKDNQFAILIMGDEHNDGVHNDNNNDNVSSLIIDFPTDAIDYGDGTCWVECRIRRRINDDSDELLVVTGWSLKQRNVDGSWLVDGLDWQDFRDEFRPGIGREEWERICG